MAKPNLFFPTPVWTSEVENYKKINEEIYQYIKNNQSIDNDLLPYPSPYYKDLRHLNIKEEPRDKQPASLHK